MAMCPALIQRTSTQSVPTRVPMETSSAGGQLPGDARHPTTRQVGVDHHQLV